MEIIAESFLKEVLGGKVVTGTTVSGINVKCL